MEGKMNLIKVLVVDDSSFFRNTFKKILVNEEIEVIGTANDGKDAIEKALDLKPDIITMDIEMPVMDGLEALAEIMKVYPTPILMVSSLTSAVADATMKALHNGAIDFVTKKSGFGEMEGMKKDIQKKIIAICNNSNLKSIFDRRRKIAQKDDIQPTIIHPNSECQVINRLNITRQFEAVAIGVSTGGPVALKEFFANLSPGFSYPIFITQHMPPEFTKSLSARLNRESGHNIKEAEDGELVKPGVAYIAQGGKHISVSPTKKIKLLDQPSDVLYKPSVDIMMDSIIRTYGNKSIGIMLTGMGSDGATGFARLHNEGGYVIVQSPDTCVVSGMVDSCIKREAVDMICPINRIANTLNKHFRI
jgi:two-component system chemotaxis response regulator CheB